MATDLLASLPARFDRALASGSLLFFPSTVHTHEDSGVEFEIRLCLALQHKPKLPTPHFDPDHDQVLTGKLDPFAPPYNPDLFVGKLEDEENGAAYAVLLNKYSVVKEHFLLVTKVTALYFIPSFFSNAATLYQYTSSDDDFDWNGGWPMGDYDVNMDETNQHIAGNGGRFFMAAVTPWFFTHFNYKNWLYRSDDWLYNSRWEELLANRNEVDIVEIATWNDFGESHYIGPIAPDQDQPNSGWVDGFPHSPWTDMTLYYAQAFKTGQFPAITKDSVYIWSRPHPANAQATNDGLGPPTGASWTADKLWAVVFCTGPGQLTLTSGSNSQAYVVSAGVTKLSIPNAPGTIRATLIRNGVTVVDVAPTSSQFQFITSPPQYNFNAYVAGGHSS